MTILKPFLILTITILITQNASAQTRENIFKNQIKLSPMRIIDFVNPGIEISYERLHAKKFSTQLSAAYMKDFLNVGGYYNFKGFRVALEEKYFIEQKVKKDYRKYFSTDIVYYKTVFTDGARFGYELPWVDSLARTYNYADTFTAHKQTITLNFKVGAQMLIGRCVIDICAGIGLKYRDVKHFDRLIPSDKMEMPRHPNAYYLAAKEGQYFTLNIPMNIKVGYIF